ncbi:MAG: C45 family autoproteolytic acyltransferase/hydrolase [Pirellulaceae bacterium]|nr:C45 family autoproteolytic acyltransferase/hydrolase [Pirellulaceae bacterium]
MKTIIRFACLLLALVSLVSSAQAETVARCGAGWLERIDGYPVLHLKGTPYEMGYQHGVLFKDHVRENARYLLEVKGDQESLEWGPVRVKPRALIETIIETQKRFVPDRYLEEIRGLAEGSGMPEAEARLANFIPEMFHCSGFALMNSATKDGTLYHGRVLDYAIDWRLQEHAVLIVAEPQGGIPFINVTYAGFIGSVTGMNARHVSIGEMGGSGIGHWEGVPMAWLVRDALERAETLDDAVRIFRDSPRTCQYFYVIADAKTNRAVGMEASWNAFFTIEPGQHHPLLPKPVKDTVLLSAGDRYDELARRAQAAHGTFTAETAIRLMDRPVAMKSNLHNVLFEPKSTRLWVANAGADLQPAAEREYRAFQLTELLARKPDPAAPELPLGQTARK